jgi:phosphatidate phosphatase
LKQFLLKINLIFFLGDLMMQFPMQNMNQFDSQTQILEQQNRSVKKKRIAQILIDLFSILLMFSIFLMINQLMEPKKREYTCDMSDVSFSDKKSTVPTWAVGVYGISGGIIIFIIVESIISKIFQNDLNITVRSKLRMFSINIYHAISLFFFGISCTLVLTEIGKRWIGRLRPNFLEVCKPNISEIICVVETAKGTIYNAISTDGGFCNGDSSEVEDARLSFPSGHASISSFTMLFIIIYVEARLLSLRARYFKLFIQMAAFIAAFVSTFNKLSIFYSKIIDFFY